MFEFVSARSACARSCASSALQRRKMAFSSLSLLPIMPALVASTSSLTLWSFAELACTASSNFLAWETFRFRVSSAPSNWAFKVLCPSFKFSSAELVCAKCCLVAFKCAAVSVKRLSKVLAPVFMLASSSVNLANAALPRRISARSSCSQALTLSRSSLVEFSVASVCFTMDLIWARSFPTPFSQWACRSFMWWPRLATSCRKFWMPVSMSFSASFWLWILSP
mmetsp:Transcript_45606/g.131551  ORF Transcript_45606/g.131551 Transcript_45606/m.131551 type:complete len:223 (-) Transcript_45606:409-1077(-)